MSDFKAKMHQIWFRSGLCHRAHWCSLQHPPNPSWWGVGLAAPSHRTAGHALHPRVSTPRVSTPLFLHIFLSQPWHVYSSNRKQAFKRYHTLRLQTTKTGKYPRTEVCTMYNLSSARVTDAHRCCFSYLMVTEHCRYSLGLAESNLRSLLECSTWSGKYVCSDGVVLYSFVSHWRTKSISITSK